LIAQNKREERVHMFNAFEFNDMQNDTAANIRLFKEAESIVIQTIFSYFRTRDFPDINGAIIGNREWQYSVMANVL